MLPDGLKVNIINNINIVNPHLHIFYECVGGFILLYPGQNI